MYKAFFKSTIYKLGIDIGNPFLLEWRLTRFGKELFIFFAIGNSTCNYIWAM